MTDDIKLEFDTDPETGTLQEELARLSPARHDEIRKHFYAFGYVTGCEHYPVEDKPLRVWIMRKMNESLAKLGYIERVAATNKMPSTMFDAIEKAQKALREVHEVAFRFKMPTSADSQPATAHAPKP